MIFYGVCAEVSVSALFLGGIVPGILIGIGLMIAWFFHVRKRNYPVGPKTSLSGILKATKEAFLAICLPVFIILCITTGVATATETAALAVLYALIVSGLVYREFKIKEWPHLMINAMKSTAVMMFVVGSAQVAAYMVTTCAIPQLLAKAILSMTHSPITFMILVNVLLILVGCVMDPRHHDPDSDSAADRQELWLGSHLLRCGYGRQPLHWSGNSPRGQRAVLRRVPVQGQAL